MLSGDRSGLNFELSLFLLYFVQEFLDKHNYKCTDSKGKLNKNIRFKESSFEFGEQIAVLGIVRNVTDEEGNERKVLFPVRVR